MAIARLVLELVSHITEVRSRFLSPFLPADPAHKPSDYEHEVKAACVLSHAAFEEFVEKISLHVMEECLDRWHKKRQASDSLLALCLRYKISVAVEDDEDKAQDRCFDQVRAALDEAKKKHSKQIDDNHGFSIKYLRAALTPVFINPPEDFKLVSSLKMLTAARGSFAHSASRNAEFSLNPRSRAKSPLVPEKAWEAIDDCLALCKEIARDAEQILAHSSPAATLKHLPLRKKLQARGYSPRRDRLPSALS
jgi:hypothetical protein